MVHPYQPNSPRKRSKSQPSLLQEALILDKKGQEAQAIPLYLHAIDKGLEGRSLRTALVCLASSYRNIGATNKALNTLRRAEKAFPGDSLITLFLALVLVDLNRPLAAVKLLAVSC